MPEPVLSVCQQHRVTACFNQTNSNLFSDYYLYEDINQGQCIWDLGDMPSYLPANGYDWHYATLGFSLSYLKGWNNTLGNWSSLWKSDGEDSNPQKPTAIPISKDNILLCFALNISNIMDHHTLSLYPSHLTDSFLYVHSANQMLEPSRTNAPLSLSDGMKKTYQLVLTYNRHKPTRKVPCSNDQKSFDGCILGHAVERMILEANCSLAFLGNNETACRDFASGQKAMEAYWSGFWNTTTTLLQCPKPCNFFSVDINFNTYDLLHLGTGNSHFHKLGELWNLKLDLPSSVKVISTRYSYGFISFVAELGGWLGLFLGKLVNI